VRAFAAGVFALSASAAACASRSVPRSSPPPPPLVTAVTPACPRDAGLAAEVADANSVSDSAVADPGPLRITLGDQRLEIIVGRAPQEHVDHVLEISVAGTKIFPADCTSGGPPAFCSDGSLDFAHYACDLTVLAYVPSRTRTRAVFRGGCWGNTMCWSFGYFVVDAADDGSVAVSPPVGACLEPTATVDWGPPLVLHIGERSARLERNAWRVK
jgi:hypothetical protein